MAERNTIDYVMAQIDSLTELALWLDKERREAEQYAALGASSELDVPITGAGHSDRTAARAVSPDAYAAACSRILHAMEVSLRKAFERYRYDRDPAREADNRLRDRERMRDTGSSEDEEEAVSA